MRLSYFQFIFPVASFPLSLRAAQEGPKGIKLTWDQLPPTTKTIGYTIEYQRENGGSTGTVDIDVNSTGYQLSGLLNGVTYTVVFISRSIHYNHRTTFTIGMGKQYGWCVILVKNYINAVPAKPTVSIATVKSSSIEPFWSVSTDSLVDSFTVFWKRDINFGCTNNQQGSYTTPNSSTTAYTIPGLEENSKYIIKVGARNRAGAGPRSDPVTVVTNASGEKCL